MDRWMPYCSDEGRGFFHRELFSSHHSVVGIWFGSFCGFLFIYLLFINIIYYFIVEMFGGILFIIY